MSETSIDLTPTWEEAMHIFAVVLMDGTPEGQATARDEVIRAGRLLDQLAAAQKTDPCEKCVMLTNCTRRVPEVDNG
jgi:hypothetical protein